MNSALAWLPPPELTWGIFTRLVGVVFVVAFGSMYGQITALVGERGILPVRLKLDRIERDLPRFRRFLCFPSVLWFFHGDRALRAVIALGALSGVAVIYGGPLSFFGLLAGYGLFLSLDVALRLSFPWECVLFETALLGLFLPPTLPLPDLAATAAPAPVIAWAYRILLFRVVFGFGKFKFVGSRRKDLAYLKGFLVNQPLPSAIGWYGQHLPLGVLKAGVLSLFAVEIFGSALALVPNALGLVGGAGILGLMVVINLCGNFGYFNWVVGALTVPLLDVHTPRAFSIARAFESGGAPVATLFVLFHTAGALLYFPFNSYVSQSWHRWPIWASLKPRFLGWPITALRALEPTRWLHSYGVFPPQSMAPVRSVAVVEVSYDGETWHELEYRFANTKPEHRPGFLAPYMARWDQMLIYESYGTTEYSLAYAVANSGIPYGHAVYSDAECLLQRVLEGEFHEGVLFKRGTLPRREAPKLARMRTYLLEPTTLAEHEATGAWWTRKLLGPHYAPRAVDPEFWQFWLPEPELFDFDDVVWRKRTRLGARLAQASRGGAFDAFVVDPAETPNPVTRSDLGRFFSEFLPASGASARSDWSRIADSVRALRKRFDRRDLRQFERVSRRVGAVLEHRLAPHFFGTATPKLEIATHYEFVLFTQDLVASGREVVESVLSDPKTAPDRLATFTLEGGLFLTALFRLEHLVWEAHKIRMLDAVLVRSSERFPESDRARAERKMEETSRRLWGVSKLTPLLRELFKEPEFAGGTEEQYPEFIELDSGELVKASSAAARANRAPLDPSRNTS